MRLPWFLTAILILGTLAAPDSLAQRRTRAPAPVPVKLQTKDGVGLQITYYGSTLGKDAAPVVLLHDHKATQGMLTSLAQRLQSPTDQDKHPSFAVVTVDLRGHGGSLKQTAPSGETREIDAAKIQRQDIVNMFADMEAVRSFLVGKNDAGELNLNSLALVGVGMGATVAVNWASADWLAPPLSTGKQGQDVRALVLVSPRWKYRGVGLQQALKVQPLKQNAAWMIVYGEQDTESAADARRLYRQLERYHPETTRGGTAQRDLLLVGLPSGLEGSQLLSQSGAALEGQIIGFLAAHAGNQDHPWLQRRHRSQ